MWSLKQETKPHKSDANCDTINETQSSGETRAVRPDRTSCSAFRRRYTRVFDEKRIIVLTNLRSHRLAVFTNEPLMSSGDHTSGDCSEGGSSVRPDTILRGDGIRLGSVTNERPAMGQSDQ